MKVLAISHPPIPDNSYGLNFHTRALSWILNKADNLASSSFIHFFKPDQNIMSLLKRNIQDPPPLSTD